MIKDGRHPRVRGNPIRRIAVRTDRRKQRHPELGWCWVWRASVYLKGGYAQVQTGGRNVLAHRFVYELLVGPIPDGLTLDHLCGNPPCVNPRHLQPTTQRENNMRAASSLTAVNAAKTHCPRGHPYDEENTYIRPCDGGRDCRICVRDRGRLYQRRRRAALYRPVER